MRPAFTSKKTSAKSPAQRDLSWKMPASCRVEDVKILVMPPLVIDRLEGETQRACAIVPSSVGKARW